MSNRTLGALIGIAALLLAVLVYLIIGFSSRIPVASGSSSPTVAATTEISAAITTDTSTSTGTTPKYILGEWEGKLAVFIPPSSSPDRVYDVYVSSLPEEEQAKIEAGIAVYDEQTLAGLVEDYTS